MVRRILLIAFALVLASYVIWGRVEAHRLSNAVAVIAARGEPVTFDGNPPAPQTAEQRDAASLYAQAAELAYDRDIQENHRASRLDLDAPGGTEIPFDEIRTNYRGDDRAFQLLDRATPMDFHGFEAAQREPREFGSPRLESGLIDLGSFACLRADLASIGGDAETAVAALVPCIRLERTLYVPQHRSTHGVRILGSLRIFFRHANPSDTALATLQRAFDVWPEEDTMRTTVFLDRARFIEMTAGQPFPGVGFSIARRVFHPMWLASARRALPTFDESIAIAREPWPDRWNAVEQRQRAFRQQFEQRARSGWLTRFTDPFAGLFTWDYMAIRWSASELAARRIAALAVSVERYRRAHDGAMPASIQAPEDPYSGRPLIVKQDADGYVIYGVDTDRKDDGGVIYGFGAAPPTRIGPQSPRDFGIHVPLKQRQANPGARP